MKRALRNSRPLLQYADFSRPFILETDASHSGLWAVLFQESDCGIRPIAYASQGLWPTEQNTVNCSSMKLELIAVGHDQKFQEYLLRQKCSTVFTDNKSLSYFQSAKLGAT